MLQSCSNCIELFPSGPDLSRPAPLSQTLEPGDEPQMKALILQLLASFADSIRDLLPIVAVIAFFQLVVLGQPIPNLLDMLWGMLLVLLGLALFVQGAATKGTVTVEVVTPPES